MKADYSEYQELYLYRAFYTYHTSQQMAEFLLRLYDSDGTLHFLCACLCFVDGLILPFCDIFVDVKSAFYAIHIRRTGKVRLGLVRSLCVNDAFWSVTLECSLYR